MNQKMAAAIKTQLQHAEQSTPTLGNYLNLLAKHAASVDQGAVKEERASENKMPSSASAQGMEDRNQGYGRNAKDLDDAKGCQGGEETGQVHLAKGKKTITTEDSGMPSLALGDKNAALKFLRTDSLKRRLATAGV